jgi:predicted DNA-binding transcriptional regulator AlpA
MSDIKSAQPKDAAPTDTKRKGAPRTAAPLPPQSDLPCFTKKSELKAVFGISAHKSTLLRWEEEEKFPKRVRLGHATVVWRTAELIEHLGLDPVDVAAAWRASRTTTAEATR